MDDDHQSQDLVLEAAMALMHDNGRVQTLSGCCGSSAIVADVADRHTIQYVKGDAFRRWAEVGLLHLHLQ